MEDQQPAAGDLIDQTSSDEPEVVVAEESAEADPAETDPVETAEVQDSQLVTHRPVGRWWAAVVAVAAAAVIGAAAFAGAAVEPYLADRASVATKLAVARTAANAITALWTYTPSDMDNLADRAATYLSGDFEAQYRKFVDAIVAPNKQAKITNTTEVTGVAVESLDGSNAVAIVYTNTTSTSPLSKNIPALKYLSYRLFMKRDSGRWRVERMTTITSLDLTPHL